MNRATADNQSAQAEEEGLEPTKEWVKDLVDEIIAEEFSSPDLELHWLDEDADPRATEAALEGRVRADAQRNARRARPAPGKCVRLSSAMGCRRVQGAPGTLDITFLLCSLLP